jgi:hypothetical protein
VEVSEVDRYVLERYQFVLKDSSNLSANRSENTPSVPDGRRPSGKGGRRPARARSFAAAATLRLYRSERRSRETPREYPKIAPRTVVAKGTQTGVAVKPPRASSTKGAQGAQTGSERLR